MFLPICRDMTTKQRKPLPPVGYQSRALLKQALLNPASPAVINYYGEFLKSMCDMVVVVSFSEGRANGLS